MTVQLNLDDIVVMLLLADNPDYAEKLSPFFYFYILPIKD